MVWSPCDLLQMKPFHAVTKSNRRWHIFTGIGAYSFIALVDYITTDDVDTDPAELFAWPASWAANSVFAPKKLKE